MKITNLSESHIYLVRLRAINVFGNEAKAMHWLNTNRIELLGKTPMAILNTVKGRKVVLNMLGRIGHGIFA